MSGDMPDSTASTGQLLPATSERPYTVLSLDGGGAKGFYSLGVLSEIEAMVGSRLCDRFDLVYGTSTGAIIAALIVLGHRVDRIHGLYEEYVPTIMRRQRASSKSAALSRLARGVFGEKQFTDVLTAVGIVTTKWVIERPMIFKASVAQAHGRTSTFVPGFGVSIADAVEASCSAYPFFKRKTVVTASGDCIELVDGGFCANNPTLYAIADATQALKHPHDRIRVVSVGVGAYPQRRRMWSRVLRQLLSVRLVQKTLEVNTQSMEQLRAVLFKDIHTVRINDTFERPEMATDFLEHDLKKLNLLRQRGRDSFASREAELRRLLLQP